MYVAGPLGFSEAGKYFYVEKFLPLLIETGFQPIDPWKLTDEKIIRRAQSTPLSPKQKSRWQTVNKTIAANNILGIEESKIIVAILDGTDVDSGTASEIGYGAALGKPIIGYRGDFRLCSDNIGCTINLQVEYFIRLKGGTIGTSLTELRQQLVRWHRKLSTAE